MQKKAFTLVEIMLVVGIVIILLTLAVPNFLRSRVVATEAATIGNMKAILTGSNAFYSNVGNYPVNMTDLIAPVSNPAYIDNVLAAGNKQGYNYTYARNGEGFTLNADPTGMFATFGARHFFADETGIIRSNPTVAAGPGDSSIL